MSEEQVRWSLAADDRGLREVYRVLGADAATRYLADVRLERRPSGRWYPVHGSIARSLVAQARATNGEPERGSRRLLFGGVLFRLFRGRSRWRSSRRLEHRRAASLLDVLEPDEVIRFSPGPSASADSPSFEAKWHDEKLWWRTLEVPLNEYDPTKVGEVLSTPWSEIDPDDLAAMMISCVVELDFEPEIDRTDS
ncbi:MAG: hypothetical protein HY329_18335 [Chloroflexi bacterium]|nr:hypothetical protein [Chloroflexota bacterium]